MSGLSEALLPVVCECVLYTEMLMGVMKRRDQRQAELDSTVASLTSRKADTDLFTEEIGKLEDKVECADNALKADWERWKQSMQNDTKSAFTKIWLRRTSSVVNRVLLHGNPSLHHRQISTWKKPLKINCNLIEDLYVIFGR